MNTHWAAGLLLLLLTACTHTEPRMNSTPRPIHLAYDTPVNPGLQRQLESLDATLRQRFGMNPEDTATGVCDLRTGRLALIHPDRIEYGASVPKIGILLAYFVRHPDVAGNLDPTTRHELGLIAKASSNELAAKYSAQLGLHFIQQCLNERGFYDPGHGGGIWVGKHYGRADERYPDPVGVHSHAVTVRQVLRYFLLLEQGRLESPAISRELRGIFASPDIPHNPQRFVLGLAVRPVEILRKWGDWEDWQHDAAIVTGPGRHYILVALTHHPHGSEYLVDLSSSVDDLMIRATMEP